MMEIEIGESNDHPCSCCGGTTRTVWGYVTSDGNARAVYYVSWTIEQPEHGISVVISIGGWGVEGGHTDRQTVALDCRLLENGPAFMVVDAANSAWGKEEFLGAMLSREEALVSPLSKEAFGIVDQLIEDDWRVKAFIEQCR